MDRLFPPALVACIGEDRMPAPSELATITDKIRREAFPQEPARRGCEHALHVAQVAIAGERLAA